MTLRELLNYFPLLDIESEQETYNDDSTETYYTLVDTASGQSLGFLGVIDGLHIDLPQRIVNNVFDFYLT